MFEILEEVHAEDSANSVFMSVRSRLVKRDNVTLDHDETNMTISCQVSDHQFGESISSSSILSVECKLWSKLSEYELIIVGRPTWGGHCWPEESRADRGRGDGARHLLRLRLPGAHLLLDTPGGGGGGGGGGGADLLPAGGEVPGRGVPLSRSQQTRRTSGRLLPLRPLQAWVWVVRPRGETGSIFVLSSGSLSYTFEEDQIVLLCEASANPDVNILCRLLIHCYYTPPSGPHLLLGQGKPDLPGGQPPGGGLQSAQDQDTERQSRYWGGVPSHLHISC